jgi:ATP-binding cassette subfamily B protein
MSDTVQETFAGIRVVKSFVKEGWFIKKFADTNDDYRDASMILVRTFGVFFPFITFLSGLTSLILLLVGGKRVVEGFMSPGELVALFSYFQMLIWPLMGAGFMVNMIQRGAVSLGRVNEVLNTKPTIASPLNPRRSSVNADTVTDAETGASESSAEIEIRGLNFSYGEKSVLEDITVSIPRGSWVGILGRTGSGKSTLIKTLTRTVDPPPGTVFVRGIDVRDWDLDELRSLFGVSPQDSYLFSDSIKSNIGYGLENPDDALIVRSAELSALGRDLDVFAQGQTQDTTLSEARRIILGSETLIGERGLTLSGGQKQRTAISRALIMDTEFLVLDDSLSAVDAETERRILRGLLDERERKLRQNRSSTVIVVSHRVSTLSYADTVLVLDQGRIAEIGSPRELLAQGGFYARMAELQRLEQAGEGPLG